MTFLRIPLFPLLALVLAVSLTACDSGGGDAPTFENRFEMQISPSSSSAAVAKQSTATLDGFSFFVDATDPESGQNIFAIYFTGQDALNQEAAQQGLFGFALRLGSRPATGTYSFADLNSQTAFESDFGMILFEDVGDFSGMTVAAYTYYISTGGSVTINRSDDGRVSGSLSVDATRITFDPQNPTGISETAVTVTGTFDAENGDEIIGQGFTSVSAP